MAFIDYIKPEVSNRRKPHVFNEGKEYKHCCKCNNHISLNGFYTTKVTWDNLMTYCIKCTNSLPKNKEKYNKYQREYKAKRRVKLVNINTFD